MEQLPSLATPPPIKKSKLLRQIAETETPPVDNVEDIRGYVKMFRKKHEKELVLNKREKAKEVHDMMERFSSQAHRSLFNRRCDTALGSLRTRLSETSTDQEIFSEESNENMRHFEAAAQRRWDAMKARHHEELDKHAAKKPVNDTPANFRRRSPELLQLVRQERRLFFQSRFDEAAKVRQECDRLEAFESNKQQQEAMNHWNTVNRQILDKHRREEQAMQQWIDTRKMEHNKDKRAQNDAMNKRKKILSSKINETQNYKRAASSHAIRRNVMFVSDKPRGQIETTSVEDELSKLSSQLPPKAAEILLSCKW